MFKRAIKQAAKGRVALIGPAGSGKSYTMLTLATLLAKGGRIAALDTEHRTLSKYAHTAKCGGPGVCKNPHHFEFDVTEPDTFTADVFLAALHAAEQQGYAVFCCDSLSHFWIGKGGTLEFVDERRKRARDKMDPWKDWAPHERALLDAIVASPCHVVVTMRTKTDYQDVTDPNTGQKKRIKVGLAPVQRDGLEYEFDLVGYMTHDNDFCTDKTRCPAMSGKAIHNPGAAAFAPFAAWLDEGAAGEPEADPAAGSNDNGQVQAATITAEQWTQLKAELKRHGIGDRTFLERFAFKGPRDIPAERFAELLAVARNGTAQVP